MWLEVKGGPRDQAGCTGGEITFQYPYRYVDLLGNASIAYYTATWDQATNTIKDSITGGAMFILGAAEGDPVPPRIRVIEELDYSDGTTRRQVFWARPIATDEDGLEWDYSTPEPGYSVVDGGNLQASLTGLAALHTRVTREITCVNVSQQGQPGAQQEVNLSTMGKTATLHRLQWTAPGGGPVAGTWRVRLYTSDAARDADASRAMGVDPTAGSGPALEYILDGTFSDSGQLHGVTWMNMDTEPTTTSYWLFEHLVGAPASIVLTVTLMIEEA